MLYSSYVGVAQCLVGLRPAGRKCKHYVISIGLDPGFILGAKPSSPIES